MVARYLGKFFCDCVRRLSEFRVRAQQAYAQASAAQTTLLPPLVCEASWIQSDLTQSGFMGEYPTGTEAVVCLCPAGEIATALRNGAADPLRQTPRLRGYLWLPIEDAPEAAPGFDWLDTVTEVIAGWHRLGWQVHIHCHMGISRSTLVTTAYLMRRLGCGWRDALEVVRAGREAATPNSGFRQLLERYQTHLENWRPEEVLS